MHARGSGGGEVIGRVSLLRGTRSERAGYMSGAVGQDTEPVRERSKTDQ